ncbi:MAG: amidohydrolase family protein [Sulfitobacter sp.]
MIDAHVHFWKLDRGDYKWITPARPTLMQDFLPSDFRQMISETEVSGCIAVQAARTETETDFLLDCASNNAFIKGVVGWTDLTIPDFIATLDRWQENEVFKGIRPMAGVQGCPEWLGVSYDAGLAALARRGLILEALALPHHLSGVATTAKTHDDLQIVLNHAAKPTPNDLEQWTKDIAEFSELENVACKLSGLTQQSLNPDHHARVCDVLLDVFGPHRLIWGSDHPVVLETSTYGAWLAATQVLLSRLSTAEQAQITSGTGQRIFRIQAN